VKTFAFTTLLALLIGCGAQNNSLQFKVSAKKGVVFLAELPILTELGQDEDAMRAFRAAQTGDLEGAIATERANARKTPTDYRHLHNLAIYLAAAGQWDGSVCSIRKAVEVAKARPLGHVDSKLHGTYGQLHRFRALTRGEDSMPEHEVVPLVCPKQ